MEEKEIVETVFGKHNKYEIVRSRGSLLESPKYWIYKNGKLYRGTFASLSVAVEAAKGEG